MRLRYVLRRAVPCGVLAFVLPVLVRAQGAPQWSLLDASPHHPYRSEDVFFVDPAHGWAVNGAGEVWRTADGGASWEGPTVVSGYLRATGFATPEVGWVGVLFSDERLYETRDGGQTLTDISGRIQPAIGGGICGIWVVDEQTVYAVGQYAGPAYLVKTSDGGATWSASSLAPHLDTAVDVYFFDAQHGFVLGGTGGLGPGSRPRIIETTDGGATWSVRHTGGAVGGWGWKFSFPTTEVGYASVEFDGDPANGVVMKTTDGGQTWTDLPIPGGRSLQGVGFLTPRIGWTSGRGRTSVTTDGGATWQQIDLDGQINRFRFFGDTLGFAAGTRIYRLDAEPSGTEPLPGQADGTLEAVVPNPASGPVSIRYRLARSVDVEILVSDVLGRIVFAQPMGFQGAGSHTVTWAPEAGVPSGVYLVQLRAAGRVATRAVTVVRR